MKSSVLILALVVLCLVPWASHVQQTPEQTAQQSARGWLALVDAGKLGGKLAGGRVHVQGGSQHRPVAAYAPCHERTAEQHALEKVEERHLHEDAVRCARWRVCGDPVREQFRKPAIGSGDHHFYA